MRAWHWIGSCFGDSIADAVSQFGLIYVKTMLRGARVLALDFGGGHAMDHAVTDLVDIFCWLGGDVGQECAAC